MFSEHAPAYWNAGLPVIPLRTKAKMPAIAGWQVWATSMPPQELRDAWLGAFESGNMGLVMGSQSGLCALDLDTDDPLVAEVLDRHLPPSPWTRYGSKGSVRVFRYSGEKTFRLHDSAGKGLFELLSEKTQIVMPPSIHPGTGMPYTATAELLDVLDQVQPLPEHFETKIRKAMIDAGFELQTKGRVSVTGWVSAGGRDSSMVAFCGLQAWAVMRGERSLLEALDQVETWVHTYTEKVAADSLDPNKARMKLIEFLKRDILEKHKALPRGWDDAMTAEEVLQFRREFGDIEDAWTVQDFLVNMEADFAADGASDPLVQNQLVSKFIMRLSQSELPAVEVDLVLRYLHQSTGRKVSVGAMRSQLRAMTGGEMVKGESHGEISQLLIEECSQLGEIRFDAGLWYRWAGCHWEVLPLYEVVRLLVDRFGELPAARRHSDHRGILRTTEAMITKALAAEKWHGVNFSNGYLTADLQLVPHDPKYGCTYTLPYRYLEDYPAPHRFFAFLDDCWGTDPDYAEKVEALRQVIAAAMFKYGPRFQRAICFFGRPGTGKTVLTDIIKGLLPEDSVSVVPPHDWSDRFAPIRMAHKLINFCGELSEKRLIPGDLFKNVVDGSTMTGEYKGQDKVDFRPDCLQVFCSNHLPRSADKSGGFTRRWLFLEFSKIVPVESRIEGLQNDILADEREAIACWAAGSVSKLLERGFVEPESHKRINQQLAEALNSVRLYLNNSPDVLKTGNEDDEVPENKLYMRYYAFCKTSANARVYSMTEFRGAVNELGSEYKIEGYQGEAGYMYTGLRFTNGH